MPSPHVAPSEVNALRYKWGDDLPPQQLYIEAYQRDVANHEYQSEENYIAWIRRFFYGTLLQPQGWLEMSDELVQKTPAENKAAVAELIQSLGVKISQEWAKNNKVRKIDTKNMIVWGTALRESIANEDVLGLVQLVDSDVDQLLAGEINKRDIVDDRYYVMEYDEFF